LSNENRIALVELIEASLYPGRDLSSPAAFARAVAHIA
jgi:hypothetical protein